MGKSINSVKGKMKKFVWLLAVVGSAACSQQESPAPGSKINLSTRIEPLTRISMDQTGKGSFTTGDNLQLVISGSSAETRIETYTVGTTELFWKDLGFATSTRQVRFAGCYPALTGGSGTTRTFDLTASEEKDLLLAPAVSVERGTAEAVNLSFRHAMHRLRIVYAATEDYTTNALRQVTTRCTAKAACEVDLAAGTVSRTLSGTGTFEQASASEALFLLPPQNSSDVSVTVKLDGREITINLAEWLEEAGQAQPTLEGGKELQVTMRVSKQGISFGGMEIVGWGSQGSVEGDIIL